MFYVINYYKKLEIEGFKGEKAVFVASDDPKTLRELSDKYKDFIFKDKSFYFNKSQIDDTKYTANNLLHTIFDIHFLSRSDFLVCTMTSNVRKKLF
jgi:glycoprotein 6-alpha-L-fucosyltransferase